MTPIKVIISSLLLILSLNVMASTFQSLDPEYSRQWYLFGSEGNEAESAWNLASNLSHERDDIVVAVIDDGFYINHPDLEDNIWVNPGEIPGDGIDNDGNGYIDDVHGYNFINESGIITGSPHGTHVAGVIAAKANNNEGIVGVAPGAKLILLQTDYSLEQVKRAYEYVLALKTRYLNNPESGSNIVATNSSFGYDFVDCADKAFVGLNQLYDKLGKVGVLSVSAVPNSPVNVDKVGDVPSSCHSRFLVTVTASSKTGAREPYAAFGKTSVDLAAPGEDILSLDYEKSYRSHSSTSSAAPQVTGAIALLHQYANIDFHRLYALKPSQAALELQEILFSTVNTSMSLLEETKSGGRLNIFTALEKSLAFSLERRPYLSLESSKSGIELDAVSGQINELQVSLRNLGLKHLRNALLTINSSRPEIAKALTSTITLSSIKGQETLQLEPISIQVEKATVNDSNFELQVKVQAENFFQELSIPVQIRAAVLHVEKIHFPNYIEIGQYYPMRVVVRNQGSAPLDGRIVIGESNSRLPAMTSYLKLEPGEATEIEHEVFACSSLKFGDRLLFKLSTRSPLEKTGKLEFSSLVVGDTDALVIDLNPDQKFAIDIQSALSAATQTATLKLSEVPQSLNFTKSVFISLGSKESRKALTHEQANILLTFSSQGGSIYLEGSRTWGTDPQTLLHDFFGFVANGQSNYWFGSDEVHTSELQELNVTFRAPTSFLTQYDYIEARPEGTVILANSSQATVVWSKENRTIGSVISIHDVPISVRNQYVQFLLDKLLPQQKRKL